MDFTGPESGQISAGSILGHFELEEIIGAGGMGLVYRARDTRLERKVAIKVLSPELFKIERARSRFAREAKLAASISHPNVAMIHEIDEQEGLSFIAMELVEGSTLKDLLSSGPLPLPQVFSISRQVCNALEAAHDLGIVHRDVDVQNLDAKRRRTLLAKSRRAKATEAADLRPPP